MEDLILNEIKEQCLGAVSSAQARMSMNKLKSNKACLKYKLILDLIVEHEERVKKVE